MSRELDVLIPVGERVDDLDALHRTYLEALTAAGFEPRFIYVLDGASDEAQAALRAIAERAPNVKVIQLSRRFGEASAIMAGFSSSQADYLLVLPAYEQIDPGALGKLLTKLGAADLITARRWPRWDSRAKRAQTWIFETSVSLVSGTHYRDLGCGVHLLRRDVFQDLQLYGEQHRFLPILAEDAGYRVEEIDLPQGKKDIERPMQGPGVYLQRLLDLITVFFLTRFVRRPLRFFGPIGAVFAAFGGIALAVVIVQRLWLGMPLADRPALLLSSLLVALGLQIFGIGLVGELIVFINARSIKQYRIRQVYESAPASVLQAPTRNVS